MITSLFRLGATVTTRAVHDTLACDHTGEGAVFITQCVNRHIAGDWGDLDPDDATANNHALRDGERILSAYLIPPALAARLNITAAKVWIITERDRSSTTVLFPSDY